MTQDQQTNEEENDLDEAYNDLKAVYEDMVDQLSTLRELITDLLTDLVRNGYVDDLKGEIESRCDPVVLRNLADYVGVEL